MKKTFSVNVSKADQQTFEIRNLRPTPKLQEVSSGNRDVDVFLVPFRTSEEVDSRNRRFNDEFSLRFYLPRATAETEGRPIKRLFILLNGFAEGTTDFWDGMAASFAAAGIASVLFPLPDHFCRNIFYNLNSFEGDSFQLQNTDEMNLKLYTQIMKQELLAHPERFIRFNRQLMGDIGKLLSFFDDPLLFGDTVFQNFFSQHFSRDLSVSMIGYSMGGLCALQAFLRQPNRFLSCILLNSGASFNDMDGTEMFGKAEWKEHQRNLAKAGRQHWREVDQNPYFEHIMLGNSRRDLQDLLRTHCNRILVLVGGTDSIINLRRLAFQEPEESGLAIVQIPGLQHHINIRTRAGIVWKDWHRFAADTILSFDLNHPKDTATQEAQNSLEF